MAMTDPLVTHEAAFRLAAFAVAFAVIAGLEWLRPRQTLSEPRRVRWPRNLALLILNGVILRFTLPLLAVGTALFAAERGIGLFHYLTWPPVVEIALAIVVLDLTLYLQHRLLHWLPLLWRIHRLHHADRDLDVTSGGRFHPFEIILSMAVKMAVVLALGASPAAVILFEIILNATSLFEHSNIRLPARLDRGLRRVIVTPDMHRVHHSEDGGDHNHNFGFALSLWDHLFGSYRAEPIAAPLVIGLASRRDRRALALGALLLDPFQPETRGQPEAIARDRP